MIVFELNGELNYMIPVLFSVVISYAVSNNLAISIFDVLLEMKDLPYLPALKSADMYDKTAKDIMNKNFLYLTEDSRLKDIVVLLQYLGPYSRSIPVVESEEDRVLLYAVQAQSLRKYLFSNYTENRNKFDDETRAKMNKYFSSLYAISKVNLRKINAKVKPNSEEEFVLRFMKDDGNISGNIRTFAFEDLNEMEEDSEAYVGDKKKSASLINEFNKRELYDKENEDTTSYNAKSEFWNTKIDYDHDFLDIDKSPFAIMSDTELTKVHFLFLMLSISQLFVTRRGV
jgi:CBS domain-containing protein